jgi:predicted nucleotide-binding protein
MKIPSDLLGVRPIDYPMGDPEGITARLRPACTEIRKIIERLGPI